ncbi:pilus assembly protein TadG-related protein [Nocardiopsis sp. EMB25]|uniref:pilus assembly protein TadG-related protein n=1 Tax=Nocardiopsis sp. EMB25 TaxID=2835867 RepID=UPI002283CF08|nr:pilus assembly protein TadG-related protein [Nocardiopsis sp. EMB25]MCY9785175.1 pilus assembly protein TadG-related protein [Nocardiopsis sp. EMB25]
MNRLTERWRGQDEGQASVFLLMLVPVVMIVFALVWEAGQMLVAKAELLSVAHSAARAGAHQLDGSASLAGGSPVLDADRASQAALDHLGSAGLGGQVVVEDNRVVVLARSTFTPALLPVGSREIEAEATATALHPPLG